MSSIANLSVTTSEDFIVINDTKYWFQDHGAYDPNLFEKELSAIIHPNTVNIDTLGRIMISS